MMSTYTRRFLGGVALVVGGLIVVACVVHYRGKWALERYQRELLAQGEKLTIEELTEEAVMPENNGAPIFSQVMFHWPGANLLETNAPPAMRAIAPGKAMVGWAQPDVRTWEGTNTWEQVETALAKYKEGLELVREAAERPVFDFQLNYRQGPSLLLPHLAPLKRAVQRLTTAELCALHRGDTEEATTNVLVMLKLVRAMSCEHLVISQLVRIAMANLAMAATWELLQAPSVTDLQLAAVQRAWADLDFIRPSEESIEFERALGQMMIERMRQSGAQFRQYVSMWGGGGGGSGFSLGTTGDDIVQGIVAGANQARWRMSLAYPDQLRALKGFQVLLEGFREFGAGKSYQETFPVEQAKLTSLGLESTNNDSGFNFGSGPNLRTLFSESVTSVSRVLRRVFLMEVARQLTVTAVALKRYQLARGQYPAELAVLVPEFVPAVPRDPADAKALRYRLKEDGTFLLYSVGEDGVDDRGDPSPPVQAKSPGNQQSFGWQQGRDLVWPAVASAEEIKVAMEKGRK